MVLVVVVVVDLKEMVLKKMTTMKKMGASAGVGKIVDERNINVTEFRRKVYLTIMSSANFEECAHKLLRAKIPDEMVPELCSMILECCMNERSYKRFYGLLAQRFCDIALVYRKGFGDLFTERYELAHRLDNTKLRHMAQLYAHIMYSDSIHWDIMTCVKLNEEDTSSASRIFLKYLLQELSEYMGLPKLNERFSDPTMQGAFSNLFPRDTPKNTRFAINFLTAIGCGGLTDDLRDHLKEAVRLAKEEKKRKMEAEESSSSSSGSDSSSSDSDSDSSSSSSSSRSGSSSSGSDSDSRSSDKEEKSAKRDYDVGKVKSDSDSSDDNSESGGAAARRRRRRHFNGGDSSEGGESNRMMRRRRSSPLSSDDAKSRRHNASTPTHRSGYVARRRSTSPRTDTRGKYSDLSSDSRRGREASSPQPKAGEDERQFDRLNYGEERGQNGARADDILKRKLPDRVEENGSSGEGSERCSSKGGTPRHKRVRRDSAAPAGGDTNPDIRSHRKESFGRHDSASDYETSMDEDEDTRPRIRSVVVRD